MPVPTTDTAPRTFTCEFLLDQLCGFIDAHENVFNAEIIKTQTYIERGPITPRRCLVVEIYGGAGNRIWLRLDRKPSSGSRPLSGSRRIYANHRVRLSSTKIAHALSLMCLIGHHGAVSEDADPGEEVRSRGDKCVPRFPGNPM